MSQPLSKRSRSESSSAEQHETTSVVASSVVQTSVALPTVILPSPFRDITRIDSLTNFVLSVRGELQEFDPSFVDQAILSAMVSCSTSTPNPNTKVYTPLPGWDIHARGEEGQILAIKHIETGFSQDPRMVCFLHSKLASLTPIRVKVGDTCAFFPQVRINDNFVDLAFRSVELVADVSPEKASCIEKIISVIVKFANKENIQTMEKLAQNGINLLSIANVAGLEAINEVLNAEDPDLASKLSVYIDSLEPNDNVRAPLAATVLVFIASAMDEKQKYEIITRIRSHVTVTRSLRLLINMLSLHLPANSTQLGKYRLEDQAEIEKVRLTDLTEAHNVILGSVVSTCDAVVSFLTKPPTEFFVLTDPASVFSFKKRDSDTREKVVGNVSAIGCSLLPGPILKLFLQVPKTQKPIAQKRAKSDNEVLALNDF